MQPHELLDIFHLLVQRHLHALEDLRNPAGTHDLMTMEGPSKGRVIPLCGRFCYIMKEGRPSEPDIRLGPYLFHLHIIFEHIVLETAFCNRLHLEGSDIVQDFKSMGEILLVTLSLNGFHTLKSGQLRQDMIQHTCLVQKTESDRRLRSHEDLVEFLHDSFLGEDLHAVEIPLYGFDGFRHYPETHLIGGKLGGKPDCTHHPQRVVAICGVGIERCPDYAGRQVTYASERVHKGTEVLLLKAEGHSVYGEVTPQLVIFQSTVLDDGLA